MDVLEAARAMRKQGWHEWMVENDKWKEAVRGYNASVSFADDMIGRRLDALENGPTGDNTIIVLWTDHGYHLGHLRLSPGKSHFYEFDARVSLHRKVLVVYTS